MSLPSITLPAIPAIPAITAPQIAALPADQLHALDLALTALASNLKSARANFNTALVQRFGEAARASLRASGRDFGTTHLDAEGLRVTFELGKRISWDQKKLALIADRIAAAGERLSDYVDVAYSVSETRYGAWPEALCAQFSSARTVQEASPKFTLALTSTEGAQ
jgi:hypothetical protein